MRDKIVWQWDDWQKEVLEYDGNICIRSGRQVGKSVVVAEKVKRFALQYEGKIILVVAASQRQASLLFEKIKSSLELENVKFLEPPTLTKMLLKNGSKIFCLPAGKTGTYIRGYSLDFLVVDESAYVPEVVFNSIIPMIAVSRKTRGLGRIILLSTPFGKGGYFYDCFTDPEFRSWHVSSEDCPRIDKKFLEKEKKRMSRQQYAQEWRGEFVDDYQQFFSTAIVKSACSILKWDKSDKLEGSRFYLGVDVARYGGDENAFVVVELSGNNLRAVKCEVTNNVSTVDTINKVINLESQFNFGKIFVDDAGVGGGVTDVLESKLGRKVLGLNNASKRLEVQGEEKKKGILKEDLYSNVLVLLEQGRLALLNDLGLVRSMTSIKFEYSSNVANRVMISGGYAHLTEALVRACWCVKEKGLDIYCF